MRILIPAILAFWPGMPGLRADPPAVPRVESVVPSAHQPSATDPATIWYDSFDGPESTQEAYYEYRAGSGAFARTDREALGGTGRSIELFYAKGSHGVGGRKLLFGDCPFGRPIRPKEHFTEIYWRHYVKHQPGWTGAPAKMSRATGFVSGAWNQAFILHVWSGSGLTLTLDPVRGIRDGRVVTTKYNDFGNFKWLGNSPSGRFPVHSAEEAGRWICVEARLRLNAPGRKDGIAQLWVDGVLDAERSQLDYRSTYDERSINAVFLEAYWNDGSPVDQKRWYDDFVVSTRPIGPITAPAKPTLILTSSSLCEVEVASDSEGKEVLWRSSVSGGRVTLPGPLRSGPVYFCRVRHPGGEWSPWHQPFKVEPS